MGRSCQSDYALQSSALKGNYNFNNKRRVDFYVVEASTGRLSHPGESFTFYSDSGAECPLITESVASRFSGKRTIDIVVKRGVENTCIKRTPFILSIVCMMIVCVMIFTLEIIFHALASYLKYDIVISREILSQGFYVTVTSISLTLRTKTFFYESDDLG